MAKNSFIAEVTFKVHPVKLVIAHVKKLHMGKHWSRLVKYW